MSCGLHLDLSLSVMEETRFKAKHKGLIQRLSHKVHFTYNEIESLLLIYYKLQKTGPEFHKGIIIQQMKEFLHDSMDMTEDRFNNWVISVLDVAHTAPNIFSMESWIRALSILLRGTLEEKIKHCYSVYDYTGAGKLNRSNMAELLKNSIIEESPDGAEDSVRDLAELLNLKFDYDRDGKISFKDYRQAVLSNPLYLESLGPCLPNRLAVRTFLTTFTPFVRNVK